MTRIVILGAGSIGCWLGGHLVAGGANVRLIGRERYATQIAQYGLRLTHYARDEVYVPEVDFVTDSKALEGADIVGVCVKSQDTESAAQQILEYAPNAVVISFQNGIRNAEILSKHLPSMNVIPAIVPFNVIPADLGVFHCGTIGPLNIAKDSRLTELVAAFKSSGQDVLMSETILEDQWAKMIVNLNNALNTLAGNTLRRGLLQRDYRLALVACVEEALNVAQANNVVVGTFNGRTPSMLLKTLYLPSWAYRLVMQFIVKIDARAISSMLSDLKAGRASEVDYLQGEIVRQARKANITAPVNQAILNAVLKAFDDGKSPKLSGSEIRSLINGKASSSLGRG